MSLPGCHIIGLTGGMGSGKTTFADKLREILNGYGFNVRRVSFASALKLLCSSVYRVPLLYFYKTKKDTLPPFVICRVPNCPLNIPKITEKDLDLIGAHIPQKEQKQQHIASLNERIKRDCEAITPNMLTIAKMLQIVGQAARDVIDPDIWVKIVRSNVIPGVFVIIDDVRYDNEARFITNEGGIIIRLNTMDQKRAQESVAGRDTSHPSEHGILKEYVKFEYSFKMMEDMEECVYILGQKLIS